MDGHDRVLGRVCCRPDRAARRAVAAAGRSRREHRRIAVARTRLDDFRTVRGALGGTVHDVVLAVVTGALRSWLLRRDEPLRTSTHRAGARAGDRAARSTTVSAPTGPDGSPARSSTCPSGLLDPVERLRHLAEQSAAAAGPRVGADALVSLSGFAPPTLHALGARAAAGLARRGYQLAVTNVPGPQQPMYAAGARMAEMFPVLPLGPGQAVSIALTSYDGGVYFGVNADRDAVPDVGDLATYLTTSLAELVRAAGGPVSAPARRRSRRAGSGRGEPARRRTAPGARARRRRRARVRLDARRAVGAARRRRHRRAATPTSWSGPRPVRSRRPCSAAGCPSRSSPGTTRGWRCRTTRRSATTTRPRRARRCRRGPGWRPASPRLAWDGMRHPRRISPIVAISGLLPPGRASLRLGARPRRGGRRGGRPRRHVRTWPTAPRPWIVAVDYRTGRRIVFGRDDLASGRDGRPRIAAHRAARGRGPGVVLDPRLVPADRDRRRARTSTAAPSRTRPPTCWSARRSRRCSSSRRWAPSNRIDPRSALARLERRVRRAITRRLVADAAALRADGKRVTVLTPGAADLEVIGHQPDGSDAAHGGLRRGAGERRRHAGAVRTPTQLRRAPRRSDARSDSDAGPATARRMPEPARTPREGLPAGDGRDRAQPARRPRRSTAPLTAFAVTPALRAWYVDDDDRGARVRGDARRRARLAAPARRRPRDAAPAGRHRARRRRRVRARCATTWTVVSCA